MSAPELKPCPFCGGEAEIVRRSAFGVKCSASNHFIRVYGGTEAAAITAWNTRFPDPEITALKERNTRLEKCAIETNEEICQALGKVLSYPWFKDDKKNFPDATENDGVCVGDNIAEVIAKEAADKITALKHEVERLRDALDTIFAITKEAPELNMLNYSEDEVSQLNQSMIIIFTHAQSALEE